jgi:large subunit ribosomal protein L22
MAKTARQPDPTTARSHQSFILMSHRKLRRVANEVRGKNAIEAATMLRFMPYFAAKVILKNLVSAIHNAQVKFGEDFVPENLYVKTIMVDEGPAHRRFKPRAQGRVYKIEVPTAHLTIEVAHKH